MARIDQSECPRGIDSTQQTSKGIHSNSIIVVHRDRMAVFGSVVELLSSPTEHNLMGVVELGAVDRRQVLQPGAAIITCT